MKKLLAVLLLSSLVFGNSNPPGGIAWQPWQNEQFAQAKKEKKLILLDLEAVWCHWCHVMEKETYSDPEVIRWVKEHYIAVRVDQDSRPDISRRYEEYGWPATIIFDGDGVALSKNSGFLEKDEFLPLLKRLTASPVPEEKIARKATKPENLRTTLDRSVKKRLLRAFGEQYDPKNLGFGTTHKFLFGQSEELLLRQAWRKDATAAKRIRETLRANLKLIDPVWGGVYQYSVGDWNQPHFEKIAEKQWVNLGLYSLAQSLFPSDDYLRALNSIAQFLENFMQSPDGGYFTSQDADIVQGVHSAGYFSLDDANRRKQGIPIIDRNRYARENAWYAEGLAAAYAATGKEAWLQNALKNMEWVEKKLSLGDGGYRHSERSEKNLYLGDNLAVGTTLLKFYEVTGDRKFLARSVTSGEFILKNFNFVYQGKNVGWKTGTEPIGPGLDPEPIRDENIMAARYFNLLFHYSGKKPFRAAAEQAMAFITRREIVDELPSAGVLLADEELAAPPVHMTIVGDKKDPKAKALFAAALKYPVSYKRLEWFDAKEGALMNADVPLPQMKRAAAFACAASRCSQPAFEPEAVAVRVDLLFKK